MKPSVLTVLILIYTVLEAAGVIGPAQASFCPQNFELGSKNQNITYDASEYYAEYRWLADVTRTGNLTTIANCANGLCRIPSELNRELLRVRAFQAPLQENGNTIGYSYTLEFSIVTLDPINLDTTFYFERKDAGVATYTRLFSCHPVVYGATIKPSCPEDFEVGSQNKAITFSTHEVFTTYRWRANLFGKGFLSTLAECTDGGCTIKPEFDTNQFRIGVSEQPSADNTYNMYVLEFSQVILKPYDMGTTYYFESTDPFWDGYTRYYSCHPRVYAPASLCPGNLLAEPGPKNITFHSSREISDYRWLADLDGDGQLDLVANCTDGSCEVPPELRTNQLTIQASEASTDYGVYSYILDFSDVTTKPYDLDTTFFISRDNNLTEIGDMPDQLYYACHPRIHGPVVKPICRYHIDEVTWLVTMTCDVTIYPKSEEKCRFGLGTNNFHTTIQRPLNQSKVTHTTTEDSQGLFLMTCSLQEHVSFLGPGLQIFGVEYDDFFSKYVSFNLTYPTRLVTCEDSNGNPLAVSGSYTLAKTGQLWSCRCLRTSESYPPGQVAWYKGEELVAGPDVDVRVTGVDSREVGQLYRCRGMSALGTEKPGTRVEAIAFGPQSVEITSDLNRTLPFDLCPSGARSVPVTCTIPAEEVNPGPRCHLEVTAPSGKKESSHIAGSRTSSESGTAVYECKYTLVPKEAGEYRLKCVAQNSVFPNEPTVTAEASMSFTTQEVPSRPEVILLNQMDVLMYKGRILEGEHIEIACDTCCDPDPSVTKTITCLFPGESMTDEGTSQYTDIHSVRPRVTIQYTTKEVYDGGVCTCAVVNQNSSCAHKQTNRTFSVMSNAEYREALQRDQGIHDDGDDGPAVGAIVGGIIGALALILIIGLIVAIVWLTRKRNHYSTARA